MKTHRRRDGADDGDRARARNFWSEAVGHYERYLSRHPKDIGVRVRLGNTLRESGDLIAAAAALREALVLRPEKASIRHALAEVLDEAGLEDESLQILTCEARVASDLSELDRAGATAKSIPCPPPHKRRRVRIFVETTSGELTDLHVTIASLQNLGFTSWLATIWGAGVDFDTLQSVAPTDARFTFEAGAPSFTCSVEPVLVIRAGTTLREQCLDWLLWALDDDVVAVYCDHELWSGADQSIPVLQSAPSPLDLQTNPLPPAVVLWGAPADQAATHWPDVRRCLQGAFEHGRVRHVPLVLASVCDVARGPRSEVRTLLSEYSSERMLVVVPTRDEGGALDTMLRSLFQRASSDLVDVVVVDNGSREAATFDVFDRWRTRGVEIVRQDEPFNWSHLNNLACQGRSQPIVVFANNDMEMLSDDWDLSVRSLLALDGVGVIGARLLYPNDRVQHAGIVMDALNGEPLHEGLRVAPDEGGPLDRWVRRRPATAVTGAFMAMRRSVFDAVGGFDAENFAVSCNDVDFCLRAGAAGWTVLYAPELVLRHHESLSRGRSDTDVKLKRAAAEMSCLLERWGDNARFDPNRNPQWVGRGVRLFAGIQALTVQQVMDWTVATEWRAADQIDTPTLV